MNILSRSRLLLSVCRHYSLLEGTGVLRRVTSLNKARGCSYLTTCQQQWRYAASLRCFSEANRSFSDSSESSQSDNTGTTEERPNIMENLGSSESFTLDVLVSLLRQENAVDLCVIKVPDHINYADYFIVVSGLSPRHIHAMAFYALKVYKFLKKEKDANVKIEGKDSEDWMCIDFGNVVVHFMLPETRELYELEKLWTLRAYDEQLQKIPIETLPEDFILDLELTK
ncbi:mitochondrial assembly of ribosomal large subunit protein 1 [Nematolebias whitei]|uniref:mitochondrial assembly of ribosomal large subunit protein 1 n=1 Tax=Nematolebias whitei TaxID=451745 RepID=UPI001897857A|nr:mitochondrial assembly of ribosomal large subunit protein 1 [Nematolebias whitei]